MKINLFDNDFNHIPCSVHNKNPKHVSYIRNQLQWDGITVFTHDYIFNGMPNMVISNIKIGWLVEPRSIKGNHYDMITLVENNLDYIITHDESLLNRSNKYIFAPVGGCWIPEEKFEISQKNKLVNIIASNKNQTIGHKIRHKIVELYNQKIDCFGNGYNFIKNKEDALKDYMFSIAIENSSTKNYFTEKILDCFALGTVPIYWGCSNIEKFFDVRGILKFNSLDEFHSIIHNLDYSLYESMSPFIKNNFELFKEYEITEDWIYKNIYKDLIK